MFCFVLLGFIVFFSISFFLSSDNEYWWWDDYRWVSADLGNRNISESCARDCWWRMSSASGWWLGCCVFGEMDPALERKTTTVDCQVSTTDESVRDDLLKLGLQCMRWLQSPWEFRDGESSVFSEYGSVLNAEDILGGEPGGTSARSSSSSCNNFKGANTKKDVTEVYRHKITVHPTWVKSKFSSRRSKSAFSSFLLVVVGFSSGGKGETN